MASSSKNTTTSNNTSLAHRFTYDVFPSFRGEDTRKNFTSNLYAALDRKGIVTFRDDCLERGKTISTELMRAIEESRFSIVVLSRNYAYSSWCLDELVKILECRERLGHEVFPVFYDVDPSEVRKQTGYFGEAFAHHATHNADKVLEWKNALMEVAGIAGCNVKDRYESECIDEITSLISTKCINTRWDLPEDLVGIDSRVAKVCTALEIGSDEVRIVSICGLGGIGKKTIARVVYDRLRYQYEGSSFVADIRETSKKNGLTYLQEQILSETLKSKSVIKVWNVYDGAREIKTRLCNKKILLVLDEVSDNKQIEMLAGSRSWFGKGSRIIITSRTQLRSRFYFENCTYFPDLLNDEEAFHLFVRTAFQRGHLENGYEELCNRALHYARGLPIAIKVIASFLFAKSTDEWKEAIERMERFPPKDITDIIRISFDGMKDINEKKIFLDIACFFKSRRVNWVKEVLSSCGFYPEIGIRVLTDRSLITVSNNIIQMHKLVQHMGHFFVYEECPRDPGKRSRLWDYKDIHRVLTENTGTTNVEGIVLESKKVEPIDASAESFSKMKRLRYLQIHSVQLPGGLTYLSNELRYLNWDGYPLDSLPSSFGPKGLVELHLRNSNIKCIFKNATSMGKLKVIDMSGSNELTSTPNVELMPHLEEIILEGCRKLVDISSSVAVHKKLVILNLKDCKSLQNLPPEICLESLRTFNLSGCSRLKKFPAITGNMDNLSSLSLSGTAIHKLPSSLRHLTALEDLDL